MFVVVVVVVVVAVAVVVVVVAAAIFVMVTESASLGSCSVVQVLPILIGSLLLHDQYVNYGLHPSSASPCQMGKKLKPNFPHLVGSHH